MLVCRWVGKVHGLPVVENIFSWHDIIPSGAPAVHGRGGRGVSLWDDDDGGLGVEAVWGVGVASSGVDEARLS